MASSPQPTPASHRPPNRSFPPHTRTSPTRTVLLVVLALAGSIALYMLAVRYNYRFDLTQSQRHTLTAQSVSILQHLQQPIHVIGFFRRGTHQRAALTNLLTLYRHHTKHLTYKMADPTHQQELAHQYNITGGDIAVIAGYGKQETLTRFDEEAFTNALIRLTRKTRKVLYFITGHGEPSPTDTGDNGYSLAADQLHQQHYVVQQLSLVEEQRVPDDAAVVMIAGPQRDLSDLEHQVLQAFLNHGGRLLLMLDPGTPSGFRALLQQYGLELGNDIVIETNALGRVSGGDYHMPAVMAYGQHPITQHSRALMTIFPVARSISVMQHVPAGVRAQTLALTSPQSWAETDLQALAAGRATFDARHDRQGPISIAAVATVQPHVDSTNRPATHPFPPSDGKYMSARIVVFGDAEFANNQFFSLRENGALFLHAVRWLAEEEEHIVMPPRANYRSGPVMLPADLRPLIFWLPVVLLPLVVWLSGLGVFLKRRRQLSGVSTHHR